MASVPTPDPRYTPNLPRELIDSGKLSDVQLESIVYAGQAHSQHLAEHEGDKQLRRGFMLGDGTGVGKGRQIAGVILDNMRQGRKKALWLSVSQKLFEDAKRDWGGLDQDPAQLVNLSKVKARGGTIPKKEGILFATYNTMSSAPKKQGSKSRLEQIIEWLGEDFDGVIAFDEAHKMGNALPMKGARGIQKPSKTALVGLELQKRLPDARVLYVSATAATEVENLAYAERLGLWGRGTEFPTASAFVNEIGEGGVAAMESVAQSMKVDGSYLARNISFNDGTPEGTVGYERLEHPLTTDQKEIYDKLSEAWAVVLKNINQALKLTGAVGEKGETVNAQAKSNVMSQFWGTNQRFFNQVISAMQTPTIIGRIEQDLAHGKSAVVQLTNTYEAAQERALAQRDDEESDLEELDLTPKDALIQMVEHGFPVTQFETYIDDNGNEASRPVMDSQGNPVQNKEAVALRDQLIDELASIRVPDSPIDMILNHFGIDMAAEVTGRGRRVVRNKEGKKEIQNRGTTANPAEIKAFQDGRKRVLIFSEAGGTGASYHADRTGKNQQPRTHYLLQAGWSAAKAMQGLGRTHRSNQKQTPTYILVHTDLKGQKRFISTIARRLAQLGALTKGQRQTTSTGIFSAADNLESKEAKEGLYNFYRDVHGGNIEGLSLSRFQELTGLKLLDKDGNLRKDLPPITQFLNRILALPFAEQNRTFEEFDQRMRDAVDRAMAEGTLDQGIENIRHDSIEKLSEKTVFKSPTGAETKYVELATKDKTKPVTWEEINSRHEFLAGRMPDRFVMSSRGTVYAISPATAETNTRTGAIEERYRMATPMRFQFESQHKVDKNFTRLTMKDAEAAWDKAVAEAPKFREAPLHLITGSLLPIWNRLGGSPKIKQLITDDGERLLGRVIPDQALEGTLQNLGVNVEGGQAGPADIAAGRATVRLANGWRIMPRRVQNEERVEIVGPDYRYHKEFSQIGVFQEKIASQMRYFIPFGDTRVVELLTETRPVVETTWEKGQRPAGKARITSAGLPEGINPQEHFDEPADGGPNVAYSGAPPLLERLFERILGTTGNLRRKAILEAMQRVEPQLGPGREFVNLATLRRALPDLTAEEFDQEILDMQANGLLHLQQFHWPAGATEEQAAGMVPRRAGGHYVTATIPSKFAYSGLPPVIEALDFKKTIETVKGKASETLAAIEAKTSKHAPRLEVPSEVQFPDKDVEEALQAARGVPAAGLVTRAAELWESIRRLGRPHLYIPRGKFPWAEEGLRRLSEMGPRVRAEVIAYLDKTVGALKTPEQMLAFERLLHAEDMAQATETLGQRKYGVDDAARWQEYATQLRELDDAYQPVQEALQAREDMRRSVVGQLVAIGKLPQAALENAAYFHHQVLEFQNLLNQIGGPKNLKEAKKGFQKQRSEGAEAAHNTSFLEAEAHWLGDALDVIQKSALRRKYIDPHDQYGAFAKQAKADNFEKLVGGPAGVAKISALRELREEMRGYVRRRLPDDYVDRVEKLVSVPRVTNKDGTPRRVTKKAVYKALSAELAKADPTHEFNKRIARNLNWLAQHGVDVRTPNLMSTLNEIANDSRLAGEEKQIAALGVLKAISEREQMIRSKLGRDYQTAEDVLKSDRGAGLKAWLPRWNSPMFPVLAVSHKLAGKIAAAAEDQVFEITRGDVTQKFVRGTQRPLFLPEPVVRQLEFLENGPTTKLEKALDLMARMARNQVMSWIKQWDIHGLGTFTYQLGNLLSDLPLAGVHLVGDVATGNGGSLLGEFRRAYRDFRRWTPEQRERLEFPSETIESAWRHGVIGSGQSAFESARPQDIHDLPQFRRLGASETKGEKLMPWARLDKKMFEAAARVSEFRENLFRVAAFDYYRKALQEKRLGWMGGARRSTVEALAQEFGNDEAAAHLARNLFGDYSNISSAGRALRMIFPFWAWKDTVLTRSPLFAWNAVTAKNPQTGRSLAQVYVPLVVATWALPLLWNRFAVPDDDDELSEQQRNSPHITLPVRSPLGNVLFFRNSGVIGEFLGLFGLNEAFSMLSDKLSDRDKNLAASDIARTIGKAPLNMAYSQAAQPARAAVEGALGITFYPDLFRPRIENRDEIVMRNLSMAGIYLTLKKMLYPGTSVPPLSERVAKSFVGVSDPRLNAYGDVVSELGKFKRAKGLADSSLHEPSKFRNMRLAARNDDFATFEAARREWMEAYPDKGYQSFKSYLDRLDQVKGELNDRQQVEFENEWLNGPDRDKLQTYRDFVGEMKERMWVWWRRAAQADTATERGRFSGEEEAELLHKARELAADPRGRIVLTPEDRAKAREGQSPLEIIQERRRDREQRQQAAAQWFARRADVIDEAQVLATAERAAKAGKLSQLELVRLRLALRRGFRQRAPALQPTP